MKLNKKSIFTFLTTLTLMACLKITPAFAAEEVNIPDANLRQAILTQLGKSENTTLTTNDMKSIKRLNYSNYENSNDKKIKSLKGIEYCTNLSSLNLSNNLIEDISPLKTLVNLRYLILDNNKIYNLSPLTSLKNLSNAYVDNQKITLPSEDIYNKNSYIMKSPLLNKFSQPVLDIYRISNSGHYSTESNDLWWFDLGDTNNLSFEFNSDYHVGSVRYSFSGIAYKKVSYVEKANIADKNLRAAINKALGKSENSVISKKELLSLKSLAADHKNITSLAGIEDCKNLQYLNLNCNKITDITPLSKLTNLVSVHLAYNGVYDLSPLSKLPELSNVYAEDQNIVLPSENIKGKDSFSMESPLKNKFGQPVLDIYKISNYGKYSTSSNYLWWFDLTNTNNLSFEFNSDYHVGSVRYSFSGIVRKTVNCTK